MFVILFMCCFVFWTESTIADDYKRSQLLAYYLCLLRREQGIIGNNRYSPIPTVATDGTIAVLPCIECRNPIKPLDHWARKRYTWYYQLWQPDAAYEKVPVSQHADIVSGFYVDKQYHTLVAIGVNDSHFSGEYFCVAKNGYTLSAYHLDVIPNDPLKMLVPDVEQPDIINEPYENSGIEVVTEWSVWTACNQCGTVAERRRYGKCIIKPLKSVGAVLISVDELFRRYPAGVPCRFSWIPLEIQNLNQVYERPNYLQIELCKFYCVTQAPLRFITERIKGVPNFRIIEKIKRNRYSVREPLPALPPPVLRIVRDTVASDGLALYCPKFDSETFWKKGDTEDNKITLTTTTLNRATGNRIYVDEHGNLAFDYLEDDDQGMYSCWDSNGDLLMTATVNVVEPAKDALIKTALVLTGIVIVCVTGFYIIWSSFKMKRA